MRQQIETSLPNHSGTRQIAIRLIAGVFAFFFLAALWIAPFLEGGNKAEAPWNLFAIVTALFGVAINREIHRRRRKIVTWRSRLLFAAPFGALGFLFIAAKDYPNPNSLGAVAIGRGLLVFFMIQCFVVAFARRTER